MDIAEKAANYWTQDRLQKLTHGKKLVLLPTNGAALLQTMGLLNRDASMSADAVSKYLQVNHMLDLLRQPMQKLRERFSPVRIVDCGAGNSYLTLLVAWLFREHWQHPAVILGIDTQATLVKRSQEKAQRLGWSDFLSFRDLSVTGLSEEMREAQNNGETFRRFHAVLSLHACDTATDDALALGLSTGADLIASAPCCHAELAKQWTQFAAQNSPHPFNVMIRSPHLRRESAAIFTDALRILLVRGSGYEVTATEFVPSSHTPKNRLILAERRGAWSKEPLQEYQTLCQTMGNINIKLASLLPPRPQEILAAFSGQGTDPSAT